MTELAVLAFAAYRGTQLIVHDTILDKPRDLLYAWHQRRPDSSVRTALITLISCVYCSGWWISGVVLAVYLLTTGVFNQTPLLIHLLEWAAIAGAAVLANRWDDSRKAAS